MTKPPSPELVEPDPRWQLMLGTHRDLAGIARDWPANTSIPSEVAAMLRVARDLFAHSYFVYEFGVVAVTWSPDRD